MNIIHAESLESRLDAIVNSDGGSGEGAMSSFVQNVLDFAVPFGVFCALVLFGYAAFIMITSSGDPEKLKEAKEVATNAVIGAVMVGMGVIILSLVAGELQLPGAN